MTKPIDGTLPTAHEPEEKNGTRDISRQAAMDVTRETPQEGSVASGPEADPVAGASGPSVAEASPAQAGEGGSVDFVLAKDPEPIQTAAVPASGGDTRSADDLWAALAKDIPAPSGSEGPGSATAVASPGTLQTDPAVPGPGVKGKKTGKAPKTRAPSPGPFNGKALGPVVPARPMMRDEDGDVVPTPATVASRLFTVLALVPIVLPLVLFLVQVVFTLDTRALWYSDEVRYADAYRNMVDAGDWLVLHLNGALYPDKPPLFFWFLRGLDEAARAVQPFLPFSVTITDNTLFFAGVALSGLLCLLATHALASLVARVDRRTVLAADLVLISGFFFAALNHYLRMDLLFAAFITISHVFLFHAWVRNKAPLLMVLGYLFAGAAVLVKGPLGLAFPLLAGVCFLLWQGRITRFFKPDALFGLIVGVAVPGIWLVLAWMNAGDVFLDNILHKQILARALDTWHHAEPWYHYLMTLPLIWLPWTLVFLFLPWGRFMNKGMREGIAMSRGKDGAGLAYLWCAFLPGLILLSLVSIKIPIYCLPLFPPLAILCARAVLRMRPFAAACLQYSFAILLLVLGLAFVLLPAAPSNFLPLPLVPRGVMVLGGICLFFACVLGFLIKPRRGEGSILAVALLTTALAYPVWTVTAPSLDAFLSPVAQAEVIKEYRDAGYFPATYKVFPGTYTYYAGDMRDCSEWEDVLSVIEANPKVILALRASFWDDMADRPEGFAEVNRQIIAERAYVLVARPPLAGWKRPAEERVPGDSPTPPGDAPEPSGPAENAAPQSPENAPENAVPLQEPQRPDGAPSAPEAVPDEAPEPGPVAEPVV